MALAEPALRLTSSVVWTRDDPWFGGFSGAEISRDGAQITLITDRAELVEIAVTRKASGQIATVQLLGHRPLLDKTNAPFLGTASDAEGIAFTSRDTAYVSFERQHRVAQININTGRTRLLPTPAAFKTFKENAGLEALAIHPDGSLYTLPEKPASGRRSFDLWRYSDGAWEVIGQIPRKGGFRPVGADFDRRGRLYLLERATSAAGFRSRIRRFAQIGPTMQSDLQHSTRAGRFDNLEAITLWEDTNGTTRITLVSDDNFKPFQRTQIVEFALPE